MNFKDMFSAEIDQLRQKMSDVIKDQVRDDAARPQRFGLLLVQGFSHLAMAAAVEPLFVANWIAGRKLFSWNTLSTDGFAVKASNGTQTAVDFPLGTAEHFDV